MDTIFWISYVLLWTMCTVMAFAVFLLYRFHGQTFATAKARSVAAREQGPATGTRVRDLDDGERKIRTLGLQGTHEPTLAVFTSATCPGCAACRSLLRQFADEWGSTVRIVVVCSAEPQAFRDFTRPLGPDIAAVMDTGFRISRGLGVHSVPFALALDGTTAVIGKGYPESLTSLATMCRLNTRQTSAVDALRPSAVDLSAVP